MGDAVKSRVVAVIGPTATGKSDLGLELARRLGGEIVNADSMQLYQGMDVGTAKPVGDERRGIAHHVFDIWPVTQTASVAEYQRAARDAIASLLSRDTVPILVGGSGLYVRAVLDDLVFPGTDAGVRARLEAELAEVGPEKLHARLAATDPSTAAAILPTNARRVVRALEVAEIGGGGFTGVMPPYESIYDVAMIGLDRVAPVLDERVDARVDVMWQRGLIDEVRHLADHCGLREGLTASRALGYKQVLSMLDGELTDAEAREHTKRATKRFVRRQRSWFRADPRVRWLDAGSADLVDAATVLAAGAFAE